MATASPTPAPCNRAGHCSSPPTSRQPAHPRSSSSQATPCGHWPRTTTATGNSGHASSRPTTTTISDPDLIHPGQQLPHSARTRTSHPLTSTAPHPRAAPGTPTLGTAPHRQHAAPPQAPVRDPDPDHAEPTPKPTRRRAHPTDCTPSTAGTSPTNSHQRPSDETEATIVRGLLGGGALLAAGLSRGAARPAPSPVPGPTLRTHHRRHPTRAGRDRASRPIPRLGRGSGRPLPRRRPPGPRPGRAGGRVRAPQRRCGTAGRGRT